MHLLALLAVVGVPIGLMVGALGLQHLEQRLLGYPPPGDDVDAIQPSPQARRVARRPSRPSESRLVPDEEPATVPILLPPLPPLP